MSGLQSLENEITGAHLGEEAFAEVALGGAAGAQAEAHLEVCLECREELARFQESVSDFSLASLAWSEARSEALPLPGRVGLREGLPRMFPALSWALAALLAVGLAIPVKMHFDTQRDLHASNAGAGTGMGDDDSLNSPEQIARDNQLLAAVHFELSRSAAPLVPGSRVEHGSSGRFKAGKRAERELR